MANTSRTRVLDLVERTVVTYAASVIGLLSVDSTGSLSLAAVKVAAFSAAPAAIMAILSAFGLAFTGSASLLPASKSPGMAPAMSESAGKS